MFWKLQLIWPLALALIAGSVLSVLLPAAAGLAAAFAAAAVLCALLFFANRETRFRLLLVSAALFAAGRGISIRTPDAADVSRLCGSYTTLDCRISAEPEQGEKFIHFPASVYQVSLASRPESVSGRVQIYIDRRAAPEGLTYGAAVRIQSILEAPRPARERGGFSLQRYLSRQGIFCCAWIRDPDAVKLLPTRLGSPLTSLALTLRHRWIQIYTSRLPEREAGLVSGMVLGDYGLVDAGLIDSFRRTGTLHLLAASGFNCGVLVFLLWYQILRRTALPQQLSLALVALALAAYVVMAGCKPSIVRAGVGTGLYLLAKLLGRPAKAWTVLAATAALILVVNPLAIADIGFQLSFTAVVSIIAIAPLFSTGRPTPPSARPWQLWLARLRSFISDSLKLTAAATIGTCPVIAYHFGTFSLVSLPANALASLLAFLLFSTAGAAAALFWIPVLGDGLSWVLYALAFITSELVWWFGSFRWSQVEIAQPGVVAIAIYYAFTVYIWLLIRSIRSTPGTRN